MKHKVVCLGEILWDSMPQGLFLGGAPFNVAYHLKKLGEDVKFISKVGKDNLGDEALKKVSAAGIATDYIQLDQTLPTGFVEVNLTGNGVPEYVIKKPAAWDEIQLTKKIKETLSSSDAIIFGTLAQRANTSKNTIQWMKSVNCLKVLDLNLRKPFDSKMITSESLKLANFVKMNEDELEKLESWFNLSGSMRQNVSSLSEIFALRVVCVTCGSKGSYLLSEGKWIESVGYQANTIDTVGAGDAFLAVLVSGYLNKIPFDKILNLANWFGAYITTSFGSTPAYNLKSIHDIIDLPLTLNNTRKGMK